VGIVGRSGAGKSSMVSAFVRLADVQSGSLTVDGVEVGEVPLPLLRSRIATVPQEAVRTLCTLAASDCSMFAFSRLSPSGMWLDSECQWSTFHVRLGASASA
jgi:ABC-type cobalamin/Fe3+-siderophores transport system ATPase subunit